MNHVIIGLIVLLHSFFVHAQDLDQLAAREQLIGTTELERELISDMELRVKLNSLILEVAAQIDREHPELSLWNNDAQLIKIFKQKSEHFSQFYLDRMDTLGPQQKSLFKRAWKGIQWENLIQILKQSHLGIQTMFKRKGLGIAVALFIGFASNYIVPFIVTNIGLPWLLPIAVIMPYQLIYSMLPQKIIDLRIYLKVKKSLGGNQAYQAYMLQEKKTRQALKAMSDDNILIPLISENSSQITAINLKKNDWYGKVLNRIGLSSDNFSFNTLKKFIEDKEVTDTYIEQVLNHPRYKNWYKASLIAIHLQETLDEDNKILFKQRFNKNFIQIQSFSPWHGFEEWTKKLLKAKSIEQINTLLFEVPKGTPTRLILEVWQDIVLPHYANNTNFNYFSYRKLIEDFARIRAVLIANSQESWTLTAHQTLIRYISNSLGDKDFSNCKNSGQTILRFLLSH